jgi:ABC-type nitrate/sulfonate/bicarbonate transport system substrate-binding protein
MNEIVSMAAALILALMILSGTAGAQSRDEKYVIIGTTSKTVGYMAPWVGNIKKFFQAEGVRVDIPFCAQRQPAFRLWSAVQPSSTQPPSMP